MAFSNDEIFMERCIQLAYKGKDGVAPNPMVGCVIVHKGKIIGEGYHQKNGEAHAEVNAIASVQHKELLKEATIYVSLEPCAHQGKTPPCADLIIKHNIPNVVIGMQDPFAKVNGEGIKRLKNSGINVSVGLLENKCSELNKQFITFHTKKRPYVILKWAQTLDNFIDKVRVSGEIGEPNWITNEVCRSLVHKWRTEVDAIMVGTNTALIDNPKLNVRSWVGKSPVRVVIDRELKLPHKLNLFDNSQPTLVLNEHSAKKEENTEYINIEFGELFINNLMDILFQREISSLFVEGGQEVLKTFINQNIWDEARVFTGDKHFHLGVDAPQIKGTLVSNEILRGNMLSIYRNF